MTPLVSNVELMMEMYVCVLSALVTADRRPYQPKNMYLDSRGRSPVIRVARLN